MQTDEVSSAPPHFIAKADVAEVVGLGRRGE